MARNQGDSGATDIRNDDHRHHCIGLEGHSGTELAFGILALALAGERERDGMAICREGCVKPGI